MTRPLIVCECGLQTYEPFSIGGRIYCAVCAEHLRPALVERKARTWLSSNQRPKQPRLLFRDLNWE